MTSHRIPFENRWTNGERAWEWTRALERFGLANVRTIYIEHEAHHRGEPAVIFDIPSGFVRDWLAFHDRQSARRQMMWRLTVIVLGSVAAIAAVVAAMK